MQALAFKSVMIAVYLVGSSSMRCSAATGCRRPCGRCGGCTCADGCSGDTLCACGTMHALDSIPNPQNSALLRLQIPTEAEVFINGKKVESRGRARSFRSAILQPGEAATFAIRATLRRRQLATRTYEVNLQAGQMHDVRFAESDFKVAPLIAGLDPADDTGRSNSDNITQKTILTLRGRGQPRDHVQLIYQNTLVGTATVGEDGTWSIKPARSFLNGEHSFTAQTIDPYFSSDLRESNSLNVIVDTSPPAAPRVFGLDADSDTSASRGEHITNRATPTFAGTAEPGSSVELQLGDAIVGTGIAGADGRWSITLSDPLESRTHTLKARAIDPAGNKSCESSEAPEFSVQTQTVAAPSTPRLANASETNSIRMSNIIDSDLSAVQFAGTSQPNTEVRLFDDESAELIGSAQTDGTGKWSASLARPLAPGTYRVRAEAKDSAGNVSKPSAELIATIVDPKELPVPGTPRLEASSDSGDSNVDGITRVTTPAVTCKAEPGSTVQLLFEGSTKVLASDVTNSSGRWRVQLQEPLPEGSHRLVARTTRGNLVFSRPSPALAIVVDTTPPRRPSAPMLEPASDSGNSATDNITQVTQPVFTGKAEAGSTVELFGGSVPTPIGRAKADAGGAWRIQVAVPLGAGLNAISARATDVANNSSEPSPSTLVTINTTPPATPAKPTLDRASVDTATLTGGAEPGTTIELFDEKGIRLLASGKTTSARRWGITLREPLAGGTYLLVASRTDVAGNISASEALGFKRPSP